MSAMDRQPVHLTIRKIGNSEGVILPKAVLDRLGLKSGDMVELSEEGDAISLRRKSGSEDFERKMDLARQVMDKYKVALQKLAE